MKSTKNSGFTLMELLLIIVIMGIAASFFYLSVSNVGASSARKAASEVNYLISRCRSACLSRAGESYIELKAQADGIIADYYEGGEKADSVSLGGSRVSCTYNGTNELTDAGIKISFQRSTGAEKTGGGYTTVSSLEFTGGGAVYKVHIEPATGSHGVS